MPAILNPFHCNLLPLQAIKLCQFHKLSYQIYPEKKNYKKVFYWKDIPKVKAEEVKDDVNYILRSSEKYADIDLDFLKEYSNKANIILSDFPDTLTFGRNGIGHLLYEIVDPQDFTRKSIQLGSKTIIEFRV